MTDKASIIPHQLAQNIIFEKRDVQCWRFDNSQMKTDDRQLKTLRLTDPQCHTRDLHCSQKSQPTTNTDRERVSVARLCGCEQFGNHNHNQSPKMAIKRRANPNPSPHLSPNRNHLNTPTENKDQLKEHRTLPKRQYSLEQAFLPQERACDRKTQTIT